MNSQQAISSLQAPPSLAGYTSTSYPQVVPAGIYTGSQGELHKFLTELFNAADTSRLCGISPENLFAMLNRRSDNSLNCTPTRFPASVWPSRIVAKPIGSFVVLDKAQPFVVIGGVLAFHYYITQKKLRPPGTHLYLLPGDVFWLYKPV